MAKIILSLDGMTLKDIPLTKERTTIGRRPHNDLVIDNLAVSGEHAVIVQVMNDAILEDLGSTNGTIVNGQSIKKHFLQHQDLIELGKYQLTFIADTKPAQETADYEKTMVIRPGAMPTYEPTTAAVAAAASSNPQTTAAAAPNVSVSPALTATRPAAVQLLNGANAGKELDLVKALTTIGRPGIQVAVLTKRPQGYFLTPVEGPHPTINGVAIGAEPQILNDHDVIELSGIKLEFYFKA
ncbi:FHA domain-containing protein [Parvibium lacunae]|uniref:FHA domain-containing protein n=1 Tax=Parvibium lacunae TaxID=1888893 RepID=A0A368L345_9BURK|nr:FHA domain-containing protein [Parvibium lacunae]RCS57528.1 FHA domain-containing protein [Parvibium lacunae]